jgi:hypothetical protein
MSTPSAREIIKEKTIQSWPHFQAFADGFYDEGLPSLSAAMMRGQSNAEWGLKPSIARLMPDTFYTSRAVYTEQSALKMFKDEAHLYVGREFLPNENDLIGWWCLMQHYQAPTRLLDWTLSPYVGLYFAVERDLAQDGTVWCVRRADLFNAMQEAHKDYKTIWEHKEALSGNGFREMLQSEDPTNKMWIVDGEKKSARMIAQKGVFTVCHNIQSDHAGCIERAFESSGKCEMYKLVIPKELKPNFIKKLREINVNANTLFPGIDGLGRSVSELVRLETGMSEHGYLARKRNLIDRRFG